VRPTVLRRFAPVVLLAALAGSACSTTQNNAATVNGHEISAATLNDELKTLRCSEALQGQFVQQQGDSLAGSGEGTFDNNLVSRVLSVRVYFRLLEDRLAEDDVSVEDGALDEARKAFRTQVEGELSATEQKCVSGAYEDWFARQQVLGELANEQAVAVALEEVEVACVSHILVETEAAAAAIKAELDGGADFATLARERSTDGSKDDGGDLGCQPSGSFAEAFDAAVESLPVGEVSDPVQTEFGYHVILVQERRAATPEDVGTEGSQQLLQAYLIDVVCDEDADVSITPTYGRWDRSACEDGSSFAAVVPPEQPEAK
jgi:parvulin-like peptidyl-prolyl isomerase